MNADQWDASAAAETEAPELFSWREAVAHPETIGDAVAQKLDALEALVNEDTEEAIALRKGLQIINRPVLGLIQMHRELLEQEERAVLLDAVNAAEPLGSTQIASRRSPTLRSTPPSKS